MSFHYMGSGSATAQTLVPFTPDNAAFNYSDYCSVVVNSVQARFTRPVVDGQGFESTNPGARVRFKTDANYIRVRTTYSNLVTRADTYNGTGLVLVDGVEYQSFSRGQGAAAPYVFTILLPSSALRTIELVMPYCASVDFNGVDLPTGASLVAPAARPATRYVAIGDSITQGFVASNVKAWAYRLAVLKNWQLINHGYGGRQCIPSDGTILGNLTPNVATYLIGYNNFYPQNPLAGFKTNYKSFVNQFRLINPNCKLYCITPTYSPNSFGALTLEMYRQQIRDALTELADPTHNFLVEGAALASNDSTSFPDNVHPSDTAAIQIANALSSVVVP